MKRTLWIALVLVSLQVFGGDKWYMGSGSTYRLVGISNAARHRETRHQLSLCFNAMRVQSLKFPEGTTITFRNGSTKDGFPVTYNNGNGDYTILVTCLETEFFMRIVFQASHEIGHVYIGQMHPGMSLQHREAFCGALSYWGLRYAETIWDHLKNYPKGTTDDYINETISELEHRYGKSSEEVLNMRISEMNHDTALFFGFLTAQQNDDMFTTMKKLGIEPTEKVSEPSRK